MLSQGCAQRPLAKDDTHRVMAQEMFCSEVRACMPVGRSRGLGVLKAASGDQVCWLPRPVQPLVCVLPGSHSFRVLRCLT